MAGSLGDRLREPRAPGIQCELDRTVAALQRAAGRKSLEDGRANVETGRRSIRSPPCVLRGSSRAEATCYTTDDGEYPCTLTILDEAGSFEIAAPGMPSFRVWVEAPGEASAFAIFGAGEDAVSLPGRYLKSPEDDTCWYAAETDTEICAW